MTLTTQLNTTVRQLLVLVGRAEQLVARADGHVRLPVGPETGRRAMLIVRVVARRLDIPEQKIFSRDRQAAVALARQVAMVLCRRRLGLTLDATAQIFGRDHGAVTWALKAVEDRVQTDCSFGRLFAAIEAEAKKEIATS